MLEAARVQGRRAGVRVSTQVLRTREIGPALCERARDTHADLIYLATDHASHVEHGLGPTARYLLDKRPCRIVIETAPSNGNGAAP